MGRFVLSDAAPLICLARVDGLPWLRSIFGQVHLTQEVRDEVLTGLGKPGEEALARPIKRRQLRVHPEWHWPEPQFLNLGTGEASCIRAAVNLRNRGDHCLLLMDDREGRRAASSLGINVTGTAAVVGAAKQAGLISSARDVFQDLQQKGFRVSDAIIQGILESTGEDVRVKPAPKSGESRGKSSRAKRQRRTRNSRQKIR